INRGAPRTGRPFFFGGGQKDDKKGNDGKAGRHTSGSREHLAAMAARPVDAGSAGRRDQGGFTSGRVGIAAGQRGARTLSIGFELQHLSSTLAVNRWSPHDGMVPPA